MKKIKSVLFSGMFAAAVIAAMPLARGGIETTGEPGSPSATTTISAANNSRRPPRNSVA